MVHSLLIMSQLGVRWCVSLLQSRPVAIPVEFRDLLDFAKSAKSWYKDWSHRNASEISEFGIKPRRSIEWPTGLDTWDSHFRSKRDILQCSASSPMQRETDRQVRRLPTWADTDCDLDRESNGESNEEYSNSYWVVGICGLRALRFLLLIQNYSMGKKPEISVIDE